MTLDDFDFELPRELIAQHPAVPRDSARLLRVGQRLEDRVVRELPDLLRPGDLLVVNDTRVLPARLTGRRLNDEGGGANVEVTLHRDLGDGRWTAFARPGRKLKPGARIAFDEGLEAEVAAKAESGEVTLAFDRQDGPLLAALEHVGIMPLPPYIERPREGVAADRGDYQTIFAERSGAVAAPTAGLHFTDPLLERLAARDIDRVAVTLHVGGGTFLPIRTERVEDHRMHAEWGHIDAATAARINDTRRRGGRIVAVGTTSLRLMESAVAPDGSLQSFQGETDIFLRPGHRFTAADLLLTNFHLPRSTLFILVAAFAGLRRMQEAYAHAKRAGYRFYSYGDACLLTREDLIAHGDLIG
jgi:S-adenosylmethionine:tRNA ribosyltransferase-isomerase